MSGSRFSNSDVPSAAVVTGFLGLDSWFYRLEYAAATFVLLGILFVWRFGILHSLSSEGIALTVFWLVWPDLLSFIPIGFVTRRSKTWPSWGSLLYNLSHSLLVWAAVLTAWSVLIGGFYWPLLGWAAHLTADRAVGFHLRAPSRNAEDSSPTMIRGEEDA